MQRFVLLILIIAQCAGLVSSLPAAAAPASNPLQVGYLINGSDFTPANDDPFAGIAVAEQLRTFLLSDKKLVEYMKLAGLSDIQMTPATGTDMVQSMRNGDLHLVLATGVIYGQFLQEPARQFDYEPIWQSRRQGDIPEGRSGGVLRRGVVIMGPACPLFAGKPSTAELRKALLGSPIAVPSIDSAAGYLFPRLTLSNEPYGITRPMVWFCGSDSEVVAHVVSGLAAFGACRRGALTGTPDKYYRVLFETRQFPTDPILIRNDFLPARTDVGRQLKIALRQFFNEVQRFDRDLRVEDALPRDYESIQQALDQMDHIGAAPREVPKPADQPTTTSVARPKPVMPGMK